MPAPLTPGIQAFALSTRWNAYRHARGEDLVDEILDLGFTRLELGYDFRHELTDGVRRRVREGAVRVGSVHSICPVPLGQPQGGPELYTLASPDAAERAQAVTHLTETIRFAGEMGASAVVVHAGNVHLRRRLTPLLLGMAEAGALGTPAYEKARLKLAAKREKRARRQLGFLYAGLQELMRPAREAGVRIGLEILPTWEAFPTESEMEGLLAYFPEDAFGYWHDFGHAQIRMNLGFIHHLRWFERLAPRMVGMHIHDVIPPGRDHVLPPRGQIPFADFRPHLPEDIPLVFEPSSRARPDDLAAAVAHLHEAWTAPHGHSRNHAGGPRMDADPRSET